MTISERRAREESLLSDEVGGGFVSIAVDALGCGSSVDVPTHD